MARVVYFLSPLDDTKVRELETKNKSIGDILKDLEIENNPVVIVINGENPDDVDLDYVATDSDLIEIKNKIDGNNSSDKRGLAAVVQIVAIIAATFVSGGAYGAYYASAILIAGSVVSAHLNKRAMELMRKNAEGNEEVDVQANTFSLANANNEPRPLSPLPLIMGSHRYAPDVHTDVFPYFFGEDNTFGSTAPVDQTFYPGITSGNGAHSSTSWAVMPANYIKFGVPVYDIKIAPYHFRDNTNPLTPAENLAIIDSVKARYGGGGVGTDTIRWWDVGSEWSPLVVYHSDPSDPMYKRYNLMHFLVRGEENDGSAWPLATYSIEMGGIFSGSSPHGDFSFFSAPRTPFTNYNSVNMGSGYYYPSTVGAGETHTALHTKYGTFLTQVLNNNDLSSNKTTSYPIQKRIETYGLTAVNKTGIRASEQIFNFGIGDIEISERKVGGFDPTVGSINEFIEEPSQVMTIRKTGNMFLPAWSLDGKSRRTLRIDDSKLVNENAPTDVIPPSDNANYNWIIIRGKPGLNVLHFAFTGNLYRINGGAIASNTAKFQVQFKYSNEPIWSEAGNLGGVNVFSIENNNTRKITYSVMFYKTMTVNPGDPEPYLEARIRKMTREATDNETNYVANIGLENIAFIKSNGYFGEDFTPNAPMNLDIVRITEQVSIHGSQYKYSALVNSKCWVYDADEDEWNWQHTRNPAWWFLYFAYGGFLNLDSRGTTPFDPYPYPYSPTYGWVNYPNHPNSTEQIFGVGLTQDQIDMDRIKEWALFCEDNDLNFDMVLKDDTSCADVLERIANVGRASVSYYNGKLSVVIEDPEQTPTCLFGMGNIMAGSFSVDYMVGDPVGKVIGKFTDRANWETKEVEAKVPFSGADNIKTVEITLEGITDEDRAIREVKLLAARQYYQRRIYRWKVDIEGLIARRGDLVYLSHDSTQYGFSGRVKDFIVQGGLVYGIKSTSILDSSLSYVTVKEPNGTLTTYPCHLEGDVIVFDDVYPFEKASFWISNTVDNSLSDYANSIPEDFTFIAGARNTPGKLVRISEISSSENMTFDITAVDEDPAMWAYEYDEEEVESENFDNSEVVLSLKNVQTTDLGGGLIKLNWESVNGDFIQVINESTGLPIEANGAYSFTGGEVIMELIPGQKYVLEIKPFAIGSAFKFVRKRVRIWPR